MVDDSSTASLRIKSIEKTFAIIEQLIRADEQSITDIAKELDLSKSTVHTHLRTLEDLNYVVRQNGVYRVGLRFLHLGEHARVTRSVYPICRPEINNLIEQTGERAQIMVEEDGHFIYLYQEQSEHAIQTYVRVGSSAPIHATASGKAYLANLPHDRIIALLEQHGQPAMTKNTITDQDELFEELDLVRERGFALNMEEMEEGLRAVAAPILVDDYPVASLSLTGPTTRMYGERLRNEVPELLTRVANVLSIKVEYQRY